MEITNPAAISPYLRNFIYASKSHPAILTEKFILLLWRWKFKTLLHWSTQLQFPRIVFSNNYWKSVIVLTNFTSGLLNFQLSKDYFTLLTPGVGIDHCLALWIVQNRHSVSITKLQSISTLHAVMTCSHCEFHLLWNASQKAIWRRKQKLSTDSSTH